MGAEAPPPAAPAAFSEYKRLATERNVLGVRESITSNACCRFLEIGD